MGSISSRRKRRYDSVSEDDNESDPLFYGSDNESQSSEESCDIDSDFDDPLAGDLENLSDIDFNYPLASQEYCEIGSEFDSDSDDESNFDDEDGTDYDEDWSWHEEMGDPLAPSTSKGIQQFLSFK